MTRPAPLFLRLFSPALLLLLAAPVLAQSASEAKAPPDPFLAHLQAGQTALRAGLPLVAAREYRAAVRLRPADAAAHSALAGVLEAAGQMGEALAEYRRTVALRPNDAPAHNALAGLLEDRGESASALAEYRLALALDPADPRLHFNLAGALADAGRRREAAAQYREALRLKPDFAEAAQALRALPVPAVGAPLAAPSLSRHAPVPPAPSPPAAPGNTEGAARGEGAASGAPTATALALARAGRLREAVAAFRAVLARDPNDAAARLHLGIALYADGQKADARREWSEVSAHGDAATAAQARRLLARYP